MGIMRWFNLLCLLITINAYVVIDFNEGYTFNLTVGDSEVEFSLDTSLSDTLVYINHQFCESAFNLQMISNDSYQQCLTTPVYSISDTYNINPNIDPWSDSYGSLSVYQWGYDLIEINGTQVNITIGLSNCTQTVTSVLGLGFKDGELTNLTPDYTINYNNGLTYKNFLPSLKQNGIIEKNAYSIYFDDNKKTGVIILGGIDHSKYQDLITLQINDTSDASTQVLVDEIGYKKNNKTVTIPKSSYTTQVANGYSGIIVPDEIYYELMKAINATEKGEDWYEISESKISSMNFQITLNFDGLVIDIPWTELTYFDGSDYDNSNYLNSTNSTIALNSTNSKNDTILTIAIQPLEGDIVYVGDSLLHYVYYYVDMDEKTMSLGKLISTNSSDIESVSGLPISSEAVNPSGSTEGGEKSMGLKNTIPIYWILCGSLLIFYVQIM